MNRGRGVRLAGLTGVLKCEGGIRSDCGHVVLAAQHDSAADRVDLYAPIMLLAGDSPLARPAHANPADAALVEAGRRAFAETGGVACHLTLEEKHPSEESQPAAVWRLRRSDGLASKTTVERIIENIESP